MHIRSMPDEYFSDGAMGHNYPGRIAKPEARALWPRNSEPIFLTAGCGDYTDSHYQGRNTWFDRSCFNRLHRWHMKSINADHQYKEHRGNSTGFNRLDIYMNIQKPELDQIEALPLICSTADSIIANDRQFLKEQIRPAAFLWMASMFCFELEKKPKVENGIIQCIGSIFCRFPDDTNLVTQLNRRYQDNGNFIIGAKPFAFEIPTKVEFGVSSLEEQIEIRFCCDNQAAAISGFPNSAYNVWEIQEDWHRGQKRKLEYESDTISSKKPRM